LPTELNEIAGGGDHSRYLARPIIRDFPGDPLAKGMTRQLYRDPDKGRGHKARRSKVKGKQLAICTLPEILWSDVAGAQIQTLFRIGHYIDTPLVLL
jgi:hypothetical protein